MFLIYLDKIYLTRAVTILLSSPPDNKHAIGLSVVSTLFL